MDRLGNVPGKQERMEQYWLESKRKKWVSSLYKGVEKKQKNTKMNCTRKKTKNNEINTCKICLYRIY